MIVTDEPLLNLRLGSPQTSKLSFIEVFKCDGYPEQLHTNRSAVDAGLPSVIWLHLYSDGLSGWGCCLMAPAGQRFDLIQWASVFSKWRGLSATECMELVRNDGDRWGTERKELAFSALLNLNERFIGPHRSLNANQQDQVPQRAELFERAQSYFYYSLN
ncbi:hypothetical protein [Paenibacillus kobensis]|uniref:hypothetical protein n=1 Tax=Paenibacillus kobensis TaxID=59841 RepID=UPI000FD97843|nr:hypothetical protein [Paenibacillus kobensis]